MTNSDDAIRWLVSAGAHPWLVRHHELVVEAARELVNGLTFVFDAQLVLVGAALHDAGKIEHPEEMSAPGKQHEAAGERLLLAAGFGERIARVCVTHAAWASPRAQVEDRLIALADKLWKGKRDEALEAALVKEIAALSGSSPWTVFAELDALCEAIAAGGDDRLRQLT